MKFFFLIFFLIPLLAQSQSDFDKAKQLFKENKFEQAQPIFEKLLTKNPENLQIIEYLGDIHGNLKNWDACILYYKKLKTINPNQANYYYKYGGGLGMKVTQNRSFSSLKLVDQAKESFEKAIALNPKHIEARHALMRIYLELPGFLGGSYKKATNYALEISRLSVSEGYLAQGVLDEHKDNYSKAEANYLAAYKLEKTKVCYQKLIHLYLNKLKLPEKAKALEKE